MVNHPPSTTRLVRPADGTPVLAVSECSLVCSCHPVLEMHLAVGLTGSTTRRQSVRRVGMGPEGAHWEHLEASIQAQLVHDPPFIQHPQSGP